MGNIPPGLARYQQQRQSSQYQQQQTDQQGFPFQACMLKMQSAGYPQPQALALCNRLKQKFLATKQQQASPPMMQQGQGQGF